THLRVPSVSDKPKIRPSSDQTRTRSSAAFGGPATSLDTRACHSGLPLVSNANTSPLLVPTMTALAPAPTPAESALPAFMRQFCLPVAASALTRLPSEAAA